MSKMCIDIISQKREILSFYDGNKYIIVSTFYGVVAESTDIKRTDDDTDVEITFDICRWYGYWDLKSIITRGIKKFGQKYLSKNVTIKYNEVNTRYENSLDKRMKIELIKY